MGCRSFSIGAYPEISLSQARAKREEFRALLANGVDPQEQIKLQEQEQSHTFYSIACRWKEKRAKEVEPLTMQKNWARLERYLFPVIGNYKIDKITSPLLIEVLKPLDDQGFNDHRMFNLTNQILNYAVTIGVIQINLCQKAASAYHKAPQTNHPAIKPEQLPKLLFDVCSDPLNQQSLIGFFAKTGGNP